MNSLSKAWNWYFFEGYSGLSLAALRALFGASMLLYHLTQFAQLLILDPGGASAYFIEPIWYFEALGIERHIPWLTIPVFLVLMLSTASFTVGYRTKSSIVVLVLCIFYLKGVRDSFAGDVHHRYVVLISILFLFFFSKCSHQFSYDARRIKDNLVEEWEASWPIRAAQTYIVMFYFWALVAKLRVTGWTWFDTAGQIQAKLLERSLRSGFDAEGELVKRAHSFELAEYVWVIWVFGALVAIFELLAPVVLFVRSRLVTITFLSGAFCFHVANAVLLNVQFYIYPFVFFTFFNMAFFANWYQNRYINKVHTA